MGERRWRAAQLAGLERIPAIVRATDDTDMLRDALLENLHRSQLNPLEEAAAYQQLLDDFGCTHDELAQRIGRSRPQICNTHPAAQALARRCSAGWPPGCSVAGHARVPARRSRTPTSRTGWPPRVVAEGISVRGLEEIVAIGGGRGRPVAGAPGATSPSRPGLTELAERLSDRLETRVKVDLGQAQGQDHRRVRLAGRPRRIVDIMDPRNRQRPPDLRPG